MPKCSEELTNARREEIINACEELYKTMSFKEITIKEIGKTTSFTRTSIYNYFKTKEEIFMALMVREYVFWIEDLEKLISDNDTLSREEFAKEFSKTVERRELLLKLLSMNHYDMESNCSIEALTEFKVIYGKTLHTVSDSLEKFFKDMTIENMQNFLYTFFPFMFGIYPYTHVNGKQREAMDRAGVDYVFMSIYEITYNLVIKLL